MDGPRVGVFGGTFDPPHVGHVAVARDVADALDLDEVLWVPARRSPHKPHRRPASDEVRLEMVREAVRADPRFSVSTLELQRPAPSYTVDTLRALRSDLGPEAALFLVMGVDQYRAFERWRRPDEIRSLATLAVMDRGGEGVDADEAGLDDDVTRVPVARVDVSSTRVRHAVAEGRDVSRLVPDGVADVIAREGLYREDPG